jgi:serine/threonine protein kinase
MQRISRFRGAGRYRLLDLLSLDDLGSVWAAEDSLRRQRVTVRQISRRLAEDPRFVDRLREEMGGGLSRLSHPNVASVLDLSSEARGALYVVMEPMQGQTLAQRLRTGGPLGKAQARRIASCLADALHAAHRAGIEHGPVAPENVMLTAEGHVKLMDFGVVSASRDTRTRSRPGADASGSSPRRPHPWVPSRELESIDQLMVLMLSSSPPDDEQGPSRSQQARRALEISVLPPQLLYDTVRMRDRQPSVARERRAGRAKAAWARARRRFAVIGRPGPVLAAAAVVAVVIGVLAITGGPAADGPPQDRDGARQASEGPPPRPASVTGGVEIPNLVGQSAFQAQRRLHQLGLQYGPVVPVTGTPGVVMATLPRAGASVGQGTEITLFIGTRSDRVEGSSTPG